MRNILEYPMTTQEAIKILSEFKSSCDPMICGDIRPYAIDWVIEKLTQLESERSDEGN